MPVLRRLTSLLLAACALVVPATAPAQSTGGAAAPTGEEPMIATRHATLKGTVTFDGTFPASDAGRTVTVERFDPISGAWVALAAATVGPDGRWSAQWRADVTGRLRTRGHPGQPASAATTDGGARSRSRSSPPRRWRPS